MFKSMHWFALLVLGVLVGCGGGASLEAGGDGGDGGGSQNSENSVSVNLYSCNSFDINSPDLADCSPTLDVYDDPTTVIVGRALVDGEPAISQVIDFDTSKGVVQGDGQVLTDNNGFGYLLFGAGDSTNVVKVTANFSDVSADLFAEIHGTAAVSSRAVDVSIWAKDCPPTQAGCQELDSFSSAESVLVSARALDNAAPAARKLVTVTTNKGMLSPTDGVSLTNSDGYASLELSAGSANGIVQLTATYEDATDTTYPEINQANISIDLSIPAGTGELAKGSTLPITATLTTDGGAAYNTPVNVTFSSGCASSGNAGLDNTVLSSAGSATAIYKPTGCEGNDTITATVTLGASSQSDSVVVTIAATEVDNLEFDSASNERIFLKGSGLPTTSALTFIVKDKSGDPKQGVTVNFELASGDGVVNAEGSHFVTLNETSAISNNNGEVVVTLKSGSLPGPFRVQASIEEAGKPTILAVSSRLSVATGLPDSDSLSLSFSRFNPDSAGVDGIEVEITARAADHFNNPVADGTTFNFITEGGKVQEHCQVDNGKGSCSVVWESQNFRPADLRVNVMAWVEGEESFIDTNGDGLYTFDSDGDDTNSVGDLFYPSHDVGEPYVDFNEDGDYDNTDQLLNRDEDDTPNVYDAPNGIYDGQLCAEGQPVDQCTRELVDLSAQSTIVMSGNDPKAYFCAYSAAGGVDCTQAASVIPRGVGVAYACLRDIANDNRDNSNQPTNDTTINPIPVDTPVKFEILGSGKTQLLGRASFAYPNTNAAIRQAHLGIDNRTSCGVGLVSIGFDMSDAEGDESLGISIETPESKIYVSDSVVLDFSATSGTATTNSGAVTP